MFYNEWNKEKSMKKNYSNFNTKKIISKVSKFKYISFDMFDTLIKRDFSDPKEVFFLYIIDCFLR